MVLEKKQSVSRQLSDLAGVLAVLLQCQGKILSDLEEHCSFLWAFSASHDVVGSWAQGCSPDSFQAAGKNRGNTRTCRTGHAGGDTMSCNAANLPVPTAKPLDEATRSLGAVALRDMPTTGWLCLSFIYPRAVCRGNEARSDSPVS